jgi:membrane-associated phospholipid phosphatase
MAACITKTFFTILFFVFLCEAQISDSIASDIGTIHSADSLSSRTLQENVRSFEDPSISTKDVLLRSAGAIAITAILFHYDQRIHDNLYKWREENTIIKDIGSMASYLGDGTINLGLFGGFIGYGLIFDGKKEINVGKIGLESVLFSNATVQLLKHLCGRERPRKATRSGGFWYGPFAFFRQPTGVSKGVDSFDSFPSGHSATAFAAATTISDFYTDSWISYTCYSLATLCAISRVAENVHWMSDCFIGAIIGHYGTRVMEKINYDTTEVTIIPWAYDSQYGLLLSLNL